jgi:hypothetical protein
MARYKDEEKPPKGGWLGPPDASGVPPSHVAVGSKRGTGFTWKALSLTDKQQKKRSKFFERMRQNDREGIW